ncbi:CRTAC1 family protein [Lacihabitans sp. LS3-19]|uniref:CRTAC1 family protein n=1 Tax=Lacihabitans sp. LS3-19 TaxID=2487335 RepID=UPI0020CFB0B0|nr:CRTAC1 family protein [Lacihabitans sp. LS3-19]MCP9766861.1 CRTAC1 family protein [Lacihabitans sp. LS3-19]
MKTKNLLIVLFLSINGFCVFSQKTFIDVTKESKINHVFEVYEGMFGGGACVIDINNDGYEDLYITSGMLDDQLLLNNKNGTFTNVFEKSGLTKTKNYVTQGVVAADVNKDGFRDLFITTITLKNKKQQIPRAENLLFLNNGNGTFKDATKDFGLENLNSFCTAASFGDVNADGFPDLYIGNYFNQYEGKLSLINDATVVGANQIAKGYLLINKGGKKFVDEYEDYGLSHKGFGFGGVFTDFDNDGDQDLIINHDFGYKRTPDLLLENLYPKAKFRDVAEIKKMDLKINSMGTAVGDINNDGLMDYYFTNIRFNNMMVNQGPEKPFANKTKDANMTFIAISWGANFADFDHDGDLDLYVSNGDLNPNCVPMADFYFENQGKGNFIEKARDLGLNDYGIGRGSVLFDFDNDGDMDILTVNQKPVLDYPTESFTRLIRNDAAHGNWLKIKLKGVHNEAFGVGSKIELKVGDTIYLKEIDGGASSHLSQNSLITHFGLGSASKIDQITVTWADGHQQTLTNQNVNQVLEIVEIPKKESYWMYWLIGALILVLGGYFLKNKYL